MSLHLLTDLVLTQVTHFWWATLHLRYAATQLQLLAPGLRVLFAQSVYISYLLTEYAMWCP